MTLPVDSASPMAKPFISRFRLRIRLIVLSLILFSIALGFNVVFTSASLDKLYIDSMMSTYRVTVMDLQRKIETGLRYGKRMHNYYGLEALAKKSSHDIQETINRETLFSSKNRNIMTKAEINLIVTTVHGEVLFSDDTLYPGDEQILDEAIVEAIQDSGKSYYTKSNNTYITSIQIKNPEETVAGYIFLGFHEKKINKFIRNIFEKNVRLIGFVASVAGVALILFIYFLTTNRRMDRGWPRKKISFVIFLIIGSTQVITCGLLTRDYNNYFFQANKENATTINTLLGHDIEYLKSHRVKIDQLVGFEIYLRNIISAVPEIKDITYFDRSNQPFYRATKEQVTDFKRSASAYDQWLEAIKPPKNPEFHAKTNACGDVGSCGYFSTNVSKDILSGKVIDIALDSLTIIIISILFFVELLILTSNYFKMQIQSSSREPINYAAMRPAIFLFLFAIDLPMSFLPLHMEDLYQPLFGFTKETVMGLPISVEFLFVGISIIVSGVWLDRKGWHPPFIAGLILAIVGTLYSWVAPNALHFVLSRAVVGMGYGLSLMASQGFVITFSDKKSKAQALAHLFAGIYAGSICGNATGAIMAEWLGYTPVFLGGAFIIVLVMVYTMLSMRRAMQKPVQIPVVQPHVENSLIPRRKLVLNFLTNRSILGLIFFSSLPAAIAVIGFLNYYSPIYLKELGVSQSTIGQVLMLYGIILIYFGPFISRFVDASNNKKLYIFFGCILGGLSFLSFQFLEGLIAAVVAVMLLGFSSSLVLASQSAFALNLRVTHELGEGKAIAIFRSTSRIGQMLGPIVFSAVIVMTNSQTGIVWLGVAYLITALLFLLVTQPDHKIMVLESA